MADVFSKKKRSEIMARVRGSQNIATELRLIKILRTHCIRGWRRQYPIFGRPDLVFREFRIAIFVDGCFWHGCPIHASLPLTNRAFWKRKLTMNKTRDTLVNKVLRDKGWRVVRIWQHELSCSRRFIPRLKRLLGDT